MLKKKRENAILSKRVKYKIKWRKMRNLVFMLVANVIALYAMQDDKAEFKKVDFYDNRGPGLKLYDVKGKLLLSYYYERDTTLDLAEKQKPLSRFNANKSLSLLSFFEIGWRLF